MTARPVAIRADASADIGLGHLRRCLVLAGELRASGHDVMFIRRDQPQPLLPELDGQFKTIWLSGAGAEGVDAAATLQVIPRPSWVIVDHYELQRPWELAVRAAGHGVVAIDDFRTRPHAADILVSDVPEPFDERANAVPGLMLTGLQYALIDRSYEFRDDTDRDRRSRRVLVTMGGSDPVNATLAVCMALSAVQCRLPGLFSALDVVAGPGYRSLDTLRDALATIADADLHVAPSALAPLIRCADLVITAGGNTLLEALSLRKPCLAAVIADNQAPIVAELERRGVIEVLGDAAQFEGARLADRIADALTRLVELQQRAARVNIVDHRGAARIVAAMREVEQSHLAAGQHAR